MNVTTFIDIEICRFHNHVGGDNWFSKAANIPSAVNSFGGGDSVKIHFWKANVGVHAGYVRLCACN